MPYNSSSFERELARLKNEQAAKSVQSMSAKASDDARGTITPHHSVRANINRSIAQNTAHPNIGMNGPIIINQPAKKPIYKRAWFIFLAFSVLSTAAAPVFYKQEIAQLMGMLDEVKQSTGVDPLSAQTYIHMAQDTFKKDAPPKQETSLTGQHTDTASPPPLHGLHPSAPPPFESTATPPPDPTPSHDLHSVVDRAQAKAHEVTAAGSAASLEYIDAEARRLEEMSRAFDEKYGNKNR